MLDPLMLIMALSAIPPLEVPAPVAPLVMEGQEQAGSYEALVASFEAAESEYNLALKSAADSKARAKLRNTLQRPGRTYYPRFELLAASGEGRAMLWMIEHIRDTGLRLKQRKEAKAKLYDSLVEEHREEPWFAQVVAQLATEKAHLGEQGVLQRLEWLVTETKAPEGRAAAHFHLGRRLIDGGDSVRERGVTLLNVVSEEYPDSEFAEEAAGLVFEKTKVGVGCEAPEISGKDMDGFEFKLSDYRGKVVMLDFWGDW